MLPVILIAGFPTWSWTGADEEKESITAATSLVDDSRGGGGLCIVGPAIRPRTWVAPGWPPCPRLSPISVEMTRSNEVQPLTVNAMNRPHSRWGLLVALAVAACSTTEPVPTGALVVIISTSGADVDPDGYLVRVGSAASRQAQVNDRFTMNGITTGDYVVSLEDMASNCAVTGGDSHAVRIDAALPARVSFAIDCQAVLGLLQLSVQTTGLDLDPDGYQVSVDGTVAGTIAIEGSLDLHLLSGPHEVTLSGLAGNCRAARLTDLRDTVTVIGNGSVNHGFGVDCFQRLKNQIVFSDADQTAWVVAPDGTGSRTLAAPAFDAAVSIGGARIVTGTGAFVAGSWRHVINVIDADGHRFLATQVGHDRHPSWAPDETRFVFDRYPESQIFVGDIYGTTPTPITFGSDKRRNPAWSPDGRQIAYLQNRTGPLGEALNDLYVMDSDGSGATRILQDVDSMRPPAWAPDGTRLLVLRGYTVWLVNVDGTGLTPLPFTALSMTWSPDGSEIAFVGSPGPGWDVFIANLDGSNRRQVTQHGLVLRLGGWVP